MTTALGVNVTRIAVEEPNTELVLFTNKPNLEESHVKEEKRKKLLVMKTHAQVKKNALFQSFSINVILSKEIMYSTRFILHSKLFMERVW